MSTLKEPLNPYDFIMDKTRTNKIYMVLYENLHDVDVWCEGEAPIKIPKRMINMVYIKVNPKIVKVLYGEKDNPDSSTDSTDKSSE